MGSLSAGFACHHCDTPALTDKGGYFKYLTHPDREGCGLEPSCSGHATHMLTWLDGEPSYVSLMPLMATKPSGFMDWYCSS